MSSETEPSIPADEEVDRLIASTLYLMTCYARSRCARIACMIEMHLRAIARQRETGERVRDVSHRLAAAWVAVSRYDERSPPAAGQEPLLH